MDGATVPAGFAIARRERRGDIGDRPLAFADEFQAADHRANLMMQERSRRYPADDFFAAARNFEHIERFDRRRRLALSRAEGREVVSSDQNLRRLMHRLGIEIAHRPPDAIALQDRRGAARQKAVFVVPLYGAEARVERARRRALTTARRSDAAADESSSRRECGRHPMSSSRSKCATCPSA